MALLLGVVGAVLALVVASSLLLRWNEVRYSRRQGLPPGTMGWPLFGETTEFLKQGPSFMKARRLRLVISSILIKWIYALSQKSEQSRAALFFFSFPLQRETHELNH